MTSTRIAHYIKEQMITGTSGVHQHGYNSGAVSGKVDLTGNDEVNHQWHRVRHARGPLRRGLR